MTTRPVEPETAFGRETARAFAGPAAQFAGRYPDHGPGTPAAVRETKRVAVAVGDALDDDRTVGALASLAGVEVPEATAARPLAPADLAAAAYSARITGWPTDAVESGLTETDDPGAFETVHRLVGEVARSAERAPEDPGRIVDGLAATLAERDDPGPDRDAGRTA